MKTKARGPQPIKEILSELMTRRGVAGVRGAAAHHDAWRHAAGELAAGYTQVGGLRGGVLEVFVANSTVLQELTFRKKTLLERMGELMPDSALKELRFRVKATE